MDHSMTPRFVWSVSNCTRFASRLMRSLNQRRGRVSSGDKHTENHGEPLFLHPSRAQIHLYHLGNSLAASRARSPMSRAPSAGHHGVVVGARGDVVHVGPLFAKRCLSKRRTFRIAGQSTVFTIQSVRHRTTTRCQPHLDYQCQCQAGAPNRFMLGVIGRRNGEDVVAP